VGRYFRRLFVARRLFAEANFALAQLRSDENLATPSKTCGSAKPNAKDSTQSNPLKPLACGHINAAGGSSKPNITHSTPLNRREPHPTRFGITHNETSAARLPGRLAGRCRRIARRAPRRPS